MALLGTVWNEAFARHFGFTPLSEAELTNVFGTFAPTGVLEASLVAFQGDEPVGALWYVPDTSRFATLAPGRTLAAAERLNSLGIAVRAPARGRGLNLAMAAHAYLESVRRGATHVSYTLVLDDNWPSRRTAEKLGATVCADYVTYRRRFRRW
jgi:RimJ/RimL family protein N-acetyltransferase